MVYKPTNITGGPHPATNSTQGFRSHESHGLPGRSGGTPQTQMHPRYKGSVPTGLTASVALVWRCTPPDATAISRAVPLIARI